MCSRVRLHPELCGLERAEEECRDHLCCRRRTNHHGQPASRGGGGAGAGARSRTLSRLFAVLRARERRRWSLAALVVLLLAIRL
eukprot:389326-Prymnesium_polylepis.2